MEWRPAVRRETVTGAPVTVGTVTVRPQARSWLVRWPCDMGGFVWNRPIAVLVERGGETARIPIVDVTRRAQVGLYGLALVFGLVALVLAARQRAHRG